MPKNRRSITALAASLACLVLLNAALAAVNPHDPIYLPLVVAGITPPAQGTSATATSTATDSTSSTATATNTATTTASTTATATSTATATTTTTSTATATVTSTTTPPGPCAGIYPIGIDAATITGDAFNKVGVDPIEHSEYIDLGNGYYLRRLYVRDSGTSGSFVYLRWHEDIAPGGIPATSGQALADSLSGGGNYGLGFEEAPWPDGESAPVGYPEQPGLLNAGDWVWGSPGWKENNGATGIAEAIDAQIFLGRPMILPIYSEYRGVGSNVQVRNTRLGLFMLTGVGKVASKGPYFDFVFLGDPPGDIDLCPGARPQPGELFGTTSFYAEYAVISDMGCTPGPASPIQTAVQPEEFVNGTNGLTYPQVGLVMITDGTDTLSAPIRADTSGLVSYDFTDVPAGTYTLQAYLFYHHPLDAPGVMRMYSKLWDGMSTTDSIAVTVAGQRTEQPLELKLNGEVCPIL